MSGAYNLYVNLIANTGNLAAGFRGAAGHVRGLDRDLAGLGARMAALQAASDGLARAQVAASAETIRSQAQIVQANQRAAAAQQAVVQSQRTQARASAVATSVATRAQQAQTAAVLAGERAARAQALAQTMAARAQETAGRGAQAAARTARAAQDAADRATREHAAAQARAVTAQQAAARATALSQRASAGLADAETRARNAVGARDEAQRTAARNAQASARQVARAESELIAAVNARAAAFAQGGLVIGAALGLGVANAIQLEKAMANVLTISQEIDSGNVDQYTDAVIRLSTEVPQSAEMLADGLYQIVSTGFDGAEALWILDAAAKGASAGLTTTEVAARAALGVLKAYGLPASAVNDVLDTMFQTVNLGVITFEELASELGDVVPMAAAAGVEFHDIGSAMAAITLAGIPTAEAATALNMLFTRMLTPTREMRDAIREAGYESVAAAIRQDGLYVVVNKLRAATGGSADGISRMTKDIRATRAMLALSAAEGKNYAETYEGISVAVQRAGATERAYAIQMDTTAGQWALARNQLSALGIDLARGLLPVLQTIGEYVSVVVGAVNDLPGPVKSLAGVLIAVAAAGMLARAAFMKFGLQLVAFRQQVTAARAGGAVLPAILSGAGIAVAGLATVLTIGVAAYAAYSASKQKAKATTEELITALRAEREEGEQGAGIRKLAEQLTSSGDVKKLKDAGVEIERAIDAITSGGKKYKDLLAEMEFGKAASWEVSGRAYTYDASFDRAKAVLEKQHKVWSDAVKKESALAASMEVVNAKIKNQRLEMAGLWDLTAQLPTDRVGAIQYTAEMEAMGKALADIVDPAKAWRAAQDQVAEANRKAGRSADAAKASLSDYLDQLRKQLAAQREWQTNLGRLAASGRLDLVDHFAELGVDAAPMLDELVRQLGAGSTKVADELESIIQEGAARATPAFRAGLENLPGIAARYGKEIAAAWADASSTNDPGKLAAAMQRMALADFGRVARRLPEEARSSMEQGMRLLADVAARGGKEAAEALKTSLLTGNLEAVRTQLAHTFGADLPIEAPDLSGVVAAFKQAGGQANMEWAGALSLIQVTAATKGAAAARSLTSALLSGDMAAVKAMLNSIGLSVQAIPGQKHISVNVTTNQPPPVVVPILFQRRASAHDKDANGVPDLIQAPVRQADGGVLSFFANGGIRKEEHVAQIAPAGSWRIWGEPETHGEAYVPLAEAKRPRSKAIVEEVVRRFGGEVAWYANGGLTGFQYEAPELFSLSGIAGDSKTKKGTFSLALFAKNLDKSTGVAARWRADLDAVARRAGQDVADALADMGEDGIALTRKMATGSSKYVNAMAADLRKLAAASKASLSSYTSQLKQAVKDQIAFEQHLTQLAASGYGDLATMLAEQGDSDAETLAAAAVKDKKSAQAANDQAKAASQAVPDADLPDLVAIISAIKSSKTGIHQVVDSTGIEVDRVIEIANLALKHIKKALGAKGATFLEDLSRANRGLAFETGGILTPGLYATSNGIIRFAEPSTQGEAYIPLGAGTRGSAARVLADVAQRFGYRLTPASTGPSRMVDARPTASVQVVVVREQPKSLIENMPVTVHADGRSDAADAFGTEIMRRLRNAQRGGRI
ncbi:phage tail tape measure protein [Streptomyces sp. NPDC057638]|uniref:phage tail tape measure protein n=1 Tax=Streptomyces sp. NPDC057638 TaxID=3346190 RepID=UPI00369844BE